MGHYKTSSRKSPLKPTKRVRCLSLYHRGDPYFRGTTHNRKCPTCTAREIRDGNPPRAAIPCCLAFEH